MGDIEKAIANALKKDGIEPTPLKIPAKSPAQDEEVDRSNVDVKKSRRRKRQSVEKEKHRKKQRMTDEDSDKQSNAEEFDEYEMLNMRGASPPSQGGQHMPGQMGHGHNRSQKYYDSDGSYASSYDSYESNDRNRKQRHHRHRDRSSRKHRGGANNKREKRRRLDDSDQDDKPMDRNERNDRHDHEPMNRNNGRGNNRKHNNDGPRKAELCKFYLMECCAKGENCLYMHGDFPCKYYYLGMNKNHNRETCKFSHGKPLSDQLRNVLLKHLETAPKEIIGDFPRMPRDSAINLINIQQQKLMVKYGMISETEAAVQQVATSAKNQPPPSAATGGQSNAPGQRIPSLMSLVTNFPESGNMTNPPPTFPNNNQNNGKQNKKLEKQRKSRWCEPRSNEESDTSTSGGQGQHGDGKSEVYLETLTTILTPENLDKLSKMGIHTVKELTQLTVLQVIELGLSIAQITEIQIMAQKQQAATSTANATAGAESPIEIHDSPRNDEPEELDAKETTMRVPMQKNNDTSSEPINKNAASILNRDVDMRFLSMPPPPLGMPPQALPNAVKTNAEHKSPIIVSDTIQSPDHTPASLQPSAQPTKVVGKDAKQKNTPLDRTENEQTSQTAKIDYSQYLRDANLDSDVDDPMSMYQNVDLC